MKTSAKTKRQKLETFYDYVCRNFYPNTFLIKRRRIFSRVLRYKWDFGSAHMKGCKKPTQGGRGECGDSRKGERVREEEAGWEEVVEETLVFMTSPQSRRDCWGLRLIRTPSSCR